MIPATHPLAPVRTELENLVKASDPVRLGALLRGEGLPSLGGHEEPAELIHRAILLQPYQPHLVEQLGPVLGAYLREQAIQRGRSAGLRNGLLLAQLLPRLEPIFEGVAAVFEALPEFAADIDRADDQVEIGARLREALRWQQTDSRILDFWHRLFDSQKAEDLQDGLQGVFWVPPPAGESDAASASRLEHGLSSFAVGAERIGESEDLLFWAVTALDEACPRSSSYWNLHLSPLAVTWPESLIKAFQQRWPSFRILPSAEKRNELAKLLKRSGKFEEAERIYLENIKVFPLDLAARNGLASLCRKKGRLDEAEHLYRETVDTFPENVITLCGLAEVLKIRGKLADAEKLYRDTVERFPENAIALSGLAQTLKVRGKLEESECRYREAVYRFPNDGVPLSGLAEVLKSKGNFIESEESYREATVRFPSSPFGWNGLASLFKIQGNLREAERFFRLAKRKFPSDVFSTNGLADVLKSRGKLEEAESLFCEALKGSPGNLAARTGLAEILKNRGELLQSELLYREIVEDFPGNRVVRNGLANVLRKNLRFSEALFYISGDFGGNAEQDFIDQHLRAMILLGQGDQDEAERILRFGLKICPFAQSREYYASALALIALRKGDWSTALEHVEKVQNSVAKVLQFHAHAGLRNITRANEIEADLKGRILPFIVSRSLEVVKAGFGLTKGTVLRQPTSEESVRIFEIEIDMLDTAA